MAGVEAHHSASDPREATRGCRHQHAHTIDVQQVVESVTRPPVPLLLLGLQPRTVPHYSQGGTDPDSDRAQSGQRESKKHIRAGGVMLGAPCDLSSVGASAVVEVSSFQSIVEPNRCPAVAGLSRVSLRRTYTTVDLSQ